MRETSGLDDRLVAGRTRLLSDIEQPPLAHIGRRATAIRRRRRATVAAGALLAVAVVGIPATQPWWGNRPTPPPVASGLPAGGPVYTDKGVTVNGLIDSKSVVELPGAIADVEFADADHGFVVTACGNQRACRPSFARTADGGLTWTTSPLPGDVTQDDVLDLVVLSAERLLLEGTTLFWGSPDAGRRWSAAAPRSSASVAVATRGQVLRLDRGTTECEGRQVEVWDPQRGSVGLLLKQPPFPVCWIAEAPTADGAWWVSGLSGGQSVVAVTRDGGRTWLPQNLGTDGTTHVAARGRHAYAVVADEQRGTLKAIYHSTDGKPFTAVPNSGKWPETVAGDLVPLVDGRLLIASRGHWYLSSDDGATFTQAGGNLPAVGRLAQTTAGYVAYNLFESGWAAFSSDGATWRKFPVR